MRGERVFKLGSYSSLRGRNSHPRNQVLGEQCFVRYYIYLVERRTQGQ